mgnify:CR=1 FL=1
MGDRLQQFLCTRKFRWNILVHKKALRASDAHLCDVPSHILFYFRNSSSQGSLSA